MDSGSSKEKSPIEDPKIPNGAELLNIQIAGHRFGYSKNKLGLLRHSSSRDILKPICDDRSQKELAFYKSVFSNELDHDVCVQELRNLLPKFKGIFYDENMKLDYLRLSDITSEMVNPSLMDLKVGQKTYDPDATTEKIQSELEKYEYSFELGFRILGLRIYDTQMRHYIVEDKNYGSSLAPKMVTGALHFYVQNDKGLLERFHKQIQQIIVWFENQNVNRWKFYSSSLLFAYGLNHSSASIKMIDFAHVYDNDPTQKHYEESHDTNYLYGLRMLNKYFIIAKTELLS